MKSELTRRNLVEKCTTDRPEIMEPEPSHIDNFIDFNLI